MRHTKVGEFEIQAFRDGVCRLPTAFFPGLDPAAHPEVLDPDGTVHLPTGIFLIRGRGRSILVDAGFGPRELPFPEGLTPPKGDPAPPMGEGGELPAALAEAGCRPEDIDTVFLTHLHSDHVGWIAPHGVPYFPNARVFFGEADWAAQIEKSPPQEWGRIGMEAARADGQTEPITGESVEVAPGITARHAPGHTPGHYILDIDSNGERLLLLGDVVHTPAQLADPGISFLSDADPDLAAVTRERLLAEVEGTDIVVATSHFPDVAFQRVLPGRRLKHV